ncbi:unnamed protein product [Calicophoron daubneyi]
MTTLTPCSVISEQKMFHNVVEISPSSFALMRYHVKPKLVMFLVVSIIFLVCLAHGAMELRRRSLLPIPE